MPMRNNEHNSRQYIYESPQIQFDYYLHINSSM